MAGTAGSREDTGLLGTGTDDNDAYGSINNQSGGGASRSIVSIHSPLSEAIERTSVVFRPDFGPATNVSADISRSIGSSSIGSSINNDSRRNNSIVLAASRESSYSSSRRSSSRRSSSRKHQIILEDTGMAEESSGGFADAGAMVRTITTTSVLNLVVATAGGIGMVTLPGSFAAVGWLAGLVLLLLASLAAATSLWMLNKACEVVAAKGRENGSSSHPGARALVFPVAEATASYGGLVAKVLGNTGSRALELLTLAYCLGQLVAYLGAIRGQVLALLSLEATFSAKLHNESIIGVVALFVVFPLSLLPEESSMRFAGVLGTICMAWITATIIMGDGSGALQEGGLCSLGSESDASPEAIAGSWVTVLKNLPIFLFSMNASVTYVPVRYQHRTCLGHLVSSLEAEPPPNPSGESQRVIVWAVVAAVSFYGVCSGVAYAAYCGEVPENVVDAWPITWLPGSLARMFLVVELVVAAAGIYVPVGRAALWHLIYGPYADSTTTPTNRCIQIFFTTLLVGGGALGSILLKGALALPLAVTSALCVTAQLFVLPGLCVAAVLPDADLEASRTISSVSMSLSGGSNHSVHSTSTVSGRRYVNRCGFNNTNLATNSPRHILPPSRGDSIPGGKATALGFAGLGGLLGVLSLAALFGLLGE